jgi:hypothetical protein
LLTKSLKPDPETLALQALAWLAGEPEELERFMALSGVDRDALRARASDPDMLAAVLDYLMGHEPTLLSFCQAAGIAPTAPARARAALPDAPLVD